MGAVLLVEACRRHLSALISIGTRHIPLAAPGKCYLRLSRMRKWALADGPFGGRRGRVRGGVRDAGAEDDGPRGERMPRSERARRAAVDIDHRSLEIVGARAGEERHCVGDLLGSAEAPDAHFLRQAPPGLVERDAMGRGIALES